MNEAARVPSPVLVTGAGGFVGRRVVARLAAAGVPVRALVRTGEVEGASPLVTSARGDLFDAGSLREAAKGCRAVVHLAAKTHDVSGAGSLEDYRRINVEGTRALLEATLGAGAEVFCFVSSVKAIGEGSASTLDEDAPERPETPYGVTKLEAERLVASLAGAAGARWTVLRLPLVYGEGVKGNLARMLAAMDGGFFPPPPPLRMGRKRKRKITGKRYQHLDYSYEPICKNLFQIGNCRFGFQYTGRIHLSYQSTGIRRHDENRTY